MKKIIVILILAVVSQFVYAGGGFTIGPKVGYNASKLSNNIDTIQSDFKSGFSFGAFARIGKKIYLQPELYYTTDGGVFKSNKYDWKQKVKLGNLNIPVLVGVSFINKIVNVRILAGPMVSFVVNKSISETGGITGSVKNADINNANWYIQAGAGVDIWKLTLDLRYQVGLNKIIKSVDNAQFNSSGNEWVVSLGFKIF